MMDDNVLATHWNLPRPWRVTPLTRGTNNDVWRVETPASGYVLRVYRNQTSAGRLRFEHEILRWLAAAGLPFAVPAAIPTRAGADTATITLESGESVPATLTPLIPGQPPDRSDLAQAWAAGEALGLLDTALAGIVPSHPEDAITWRSAGDLTRCHPLVPDPAAAIEALPLDVDARGRLLARYRWLMERIPTLYASLPQQIVHDDFDPGNVLMEGERVMGVLDFEFCGRDVRVMDLVVALTWWPVAVFGSGREWPILEAVARGYKRRVSLAVSEVEAIPLLFAFRAYTSLIHRLGRYRQGLSTENDVLERARAALSREDWLRANETRLVAIVREV